MGHELSNIFQTAIAAYLFVRPLGVLIHELGHASVSLVYTKNPVTIYVGSFGKKEGSLRLKMGRLEMFLRYKIIPLSGGLCVSEGASPGFRKEILRIAAGPVASFLLAGIAFLSWWLFEIRGFGGGILLGLSFSAFTDFLVSSSVTDRRTQLEDGRMVPNDATQIRNMFSQKNFQKHYTKAAQLHNDKNYSRAGWAWRRILESGIRQEQVFENGLNAFFLGKEHELHIQLFETFSHEFKISPNQYVNLGVSRCRLGEYDAGLADFELAQQAEPSNQYARMNLAYTWLVLKQPEKSLLLFNELVAEEKGDGYIFSNRGLARLRMGQTKAAADDLLEGLRVDPEQAMVHRNLGIYYAENGEPEKAQQFFLKAQTLDPDTHLLNACTKAARYRSPMPI